ncbi:MAG: hypothetical protein QM831_43440 [Kofleriaceae bacterium]
MVLDEDAAMIYGRVLIAIARADGEIDPDEASALERIIAQRSPIPLPIGELLFAPPAKPEQLARGSGAGGGPFRSVAIDLGEIARTLVDDALEVVLAKGSITSGEQASLIRFATALGLSSDEVRDRIARASSP